MPTTSPDGLRYPASTQPPNVPLDLSNLAADVQAALTDVRGDVTALETATRDTGQRNIFSTNMNGGTTGWTGEVRIRRFAHLVNGSGHIGITADNALIGVARDLGQIFFVDANFRPVFNGYRQPVGQWYHANSATSGELIYNPTTHRVMLKGITGNFADGDYFELNFGWDTITAWPSSLPGVAI